MNNIEKEVLLKKRKEKIDKVINHRVEGEGFINEPSSMWKEIILYNYNKVCRDEISIDQLINMMENKGVTFNQDKSLIRYPVIQCIEYISKLSNTKFTLKG
ncbi:MULTISPECIES: hypothetical protein [Metabacillus]|uniref:hypothetical protein n=1 Tax=Metabacillus TaxID=2675233 RepID=UPI000C80235B|nr:MULTISPECIES: hypothetical protein [Metabacillus]MCM3443991.1 hypothetical protein [Metabacillus halosaccharovorans]PMC34958.1 hypothetical protein CJ195_20840 [Bacillus sp. UMB0899]